MEFLAIECQRISPKLNISGAREQQHKGVRAWALEYRRIIGKVIWVFKLVIAHGQSV